LHSQALNSYPHHHTHPFFFSFSGPHPPLHSFPTRRSSDLSHQTNKLVSIQKRRSSKTPHRNLGLVIARKVFRPKQFPGRCIQTRSEEHTSELQSLAYLVCRLLLEKKKNKKIDVLNNY